MATLVSGPTARAPSWHVRETLALFKAHPGCTLDLPWVSQEEEHASREKWRFLGRGAFLFAVSFGVLRIPSVLWFPAEYTYMRCFFSRACHCSFPFIS